jgi:hypothetical protein
MAWGRDSITHKYIFSPTGNIHEAMGDFIAVASSVPLLNVSVSGPANLQQVPGTYTWTANPSGGTGTYVYQWQYYNPNTGSWSSLGNAQSQSLTDNGTIPYFYLQVTVTSDWQTVQPADTVYYNGVTGVGISGPTTVGDLITCVWNGYVSGGGVGPFISRWDVTGNTNPIQVDTTSDGSDSFGYTNTNYAGFTITLTVTDSFASQASSSLGVSGTGSGCGY